MRRDEPLHDGEHARDEPLLGKVAIRKGGVVRGVDEARVRPRLDDLGEDREPADA
jgi:hypothetical protein